MRYDRGAGAEERRGGVTLPFAHVDGGDHAICDLRTSCDAGRGMLRTSSKVARERIWRRAPERHAMWDAVGDETERDVAGLVSAIAVAVKEAINLCTGERRPQSP